VLSGSLLSVLRPLLTPANARGPLLTLAPAVADGARLQVSLSNDVNSRCTTGPFISGTEHRTVLCCASLSAPSTLYGLSVRRLISFDPWLPSHGTSRSRSCLGLMFLAIVPLVMKGPTAVFTHRGLSPHQFTPMSGAHKPVEPTGTSRFCQRAVEALRRLVPAAHRCR